MTSLRRQSTDTLDTLLLAGPAWCKAITHDGYCLLDSRPTILLGRSVYDAGAARGGQPLPVAHRVYILPNGASLSGRWQECARVETIPVNKSGMMDAFRLAQDFSRWYVLIHDYRIPTAEWLGVSAIGHAYRTWVGAEYLSADAIARLGGLDVGLGAAGQSPAAHRLV